jgi:hypothetical protein
MPVKPEPMTRTVCITKDDLEKNPEATIPKPMNRRTGEERSDCKISDYKVDANTVTWSLNCKGERNDINGSGKITYGADSYDGSMQMKIGDREIAAMNTTSIAAMIASAGPFQMPRINASPQSSSSHGMTSAMKLISGHGTIL